MKPRTLWIIIVRLLGLLLLFNCIQTFLPMLDVISHTKSDLSGSFVAAFFVSGILAFLLLSRTELVIDRLRLDSSIEEKELDIRVAPSVIFRLAIAIIGLWLLVQGVIALVTNIPNFFGLSIPIFLQIVLGLLMIAKNREIAQLLMRGQRFDE